MVDQGNGKEKDMWAEFLKYVLQNVAGMIGVSIYILADTYFISASAGADGITVLNLALPIYGLIFAIGSMIGVGTATRFGIKKVQGQKEVDTYFLHALFWDLLISIPFVFLGIFAPKAVLKIMGGDPMIMELGESYMRIILIAAPAFMTNYIFTAFARNDHAPTIAMIGSLSGSIFNIIFDYIFMFPMGMGMTGAALATSLSPVLTMAICCTHYFGKKSGVRFRWQKPSVKLLFSCCQLGIAGFVGEMAAAITTVIFNMLLLSLTGNIGVAAYGIVANLSLVAMAIFNGVSQGTQPLLSRSFGLGDKKSVRKLLRWGLAVTAAVEIVLIAGAWSFTEGLVSIFNSEGNEMLAFYANDALRFYFLGYLAAGINIMLIAYFSATGQAKPAFAASMLRGAVAISISAIVMAAFWGINGVWLSFLAAEVITLVCCLWMMRRTAVSA